MTNLSSRDRLLTALQNGRPDRLPCQVHGWMDYYLDNYLYTRDWMEANARFGLDQVLYISPSYHYTDRDLANWRTDIRDIGIDSDGSHHWIEQVTTPDGQLNVRRAKNEFTTWDIEPLIKDWDDFKIWSKWRPVPTRADFRAMTTAKEMLGTRGIIRVHPFSAGQGSPWQSLCILIGTAESIYAAIDEPVQVHEALEAILQMTLKVTELWNGIPGDMIETGGGAGSNTVISPDMFREFCLPYDIRQHAAFHQFNLKIVYHLCGGVMKLLDLVSQNGADGLETMTPPSMGGDCDLAQASGRVGAQLFFIGGFDQNRGFEQGTPNLVRQMVLDCFQATSDHAGYIIAPSDHFFFGDPRNLQAFADAAKECVY